MVNGLSGNDRRDLDERGFSLIELMIVCLITAMVIGSAAMLASQVQRAYTHELDDAAVQQEGRFVLDWIGKTLASAGSNPYNITVTDCPAAGTVFTPLLLDPDADGIHDDIRVTADINPPNGVLLGLAGACNEAFEDVTIAHDAAANTITRWDRGTDAGPVAISDSVFTFLRFTFLTVARAATTTPAAIAYVQVELRGRSRAINPHTGTQTTFVFRSEVRVRAR